MARINELYDKIANQIVAQMEDGVLPWHRPWSVNPNARVSKPLRENAVPYQGIDQGTYRGGRSRQESSN